MHREAFEWIGRYRTTEQVSVLDIGGRNINGSCRVHFPTASPYTVVDLAQGTNVDIVADAAQWEPDRAYDVVVCAEVFEHTPVWPQICRTAWKACAPNGQLILTMAGPGRPMHSGIDGGVLQRGEYYRNVNPVALYDVLAELGWQSIVMDVQTSPADVRVFARKPGEHDRPV